MALERGAIAPLFISVLQHFVFPLAAMSRRFRAFIVHLVISFTVVGAALGLIAWGWYLPPGWQLRDAGFIFLLVAGVDMGLGPIATLVVSGASKSYREWRRDLALIGVVQLAGLAVGLHALWIGRPLYYVFAIDQIELVAAYQIPVDELRIAKEENPLFAPGLLDRPRWVALSLPIEKKIRSELLWRELTSGVRAVDQPRYYRPMSEERVAILQTMDRTDRTLDAEGKRGAIERIAAAAGRPTEAVGGILLNERNDVWLVVLDRKTLELISATVLD
jgi:hypothetical protein